MKALALCLLISVATFGGIAQESPTIQNVAGTGTSGYSGDSGPAKNAQVANPYGIARGPDGAIYFTEVDSHVVRRISRDGTISTVAGNGRRGYAGDGGPATKALLNEPYEVRFDKAGNMLFVEMKNHVVRKVDVKTGTIQTLVGLGTPGFSGDNGPATKAQLNQPHSIQLDAQDNVFICDIANHRIRRVDAKTGVITTFAGTGSRASTPDGAAIQGTPLNGPRALDFDREGNLWLALREGNAVYKLDLHTATIHHVAGTGKKGFTGNGGPAKQATLSGPKGLALGPDGDVYLADTESHSIRRIRVKQGTIEAVAGTGERGDGPEGNPLACRMARPHGVFVDRDGTVLIGDSEAHRVRMLRQAGKKE